MPRSAEQHDAQLEKVITGGIIVFVVGLGVAVVVHPPSHTLTMHDVYGDYDPNVSPGQLDPAHVDWLLNTKPVPSSSGTSAPAVPPHTLPPGDLSHFNDNSNRVLTDSGEFFKDKYGWWYMSQRYKDWDNALLGNSTNITIGREGCLLADFAMLQSHLDPQHPVTPLELQNLHKDWFDSVNSAGHGAGIKTPFPTLAGHKPIALNDTNFNVLHQKVRDGYAAILELRYTAKDGHIAYHYVLARGLDAQGHLLINDPDFGDNDNVPYGLNWSNINFDGNAWLYK
jgi:hypothetical protein